MKFCIPTPVAPGGVLVAVSGGDCPGKQGILRTVFESVEHVSKSTRVDVRTYAAREAFALLLEGDPNAITEITRDNLKPSSHLARPLLSFGTRGPDGKVEKWLEVVRALRRHGIRYVLQWGGDFSTLATLNLQKAIDQVVAEAGESERIYFGCLLKSIDRDTQGLEDHELTIGFNTASERLANLLQMLAWDAHHSDNFVHLRILQGKEVGHLCDRASRLGGIPLYLIPELFSQPVSIGFLADIIIGAFVKGALGGCRHMCMPVAEGCINILAPDHETPGLEEARERRQHAADGMRAELALGQKDWDFLAALSAAVEKRLKRLTFPYGVKVKLRSGCDGYSARGARPNAADEEMIKLHTRQAVYEMFRGNSSFVVAGTQNIFRVVKLTDFFGTEDPAGIKPNPLNVHSVPVAEHWSRTRAYRLQPEDLEGQSLARISVMLGEMPDQVKARFDRVAAWGAVEL